MAKTKATVELENALDDYVKAHHEYGCREVTIGFPYEGHGDEIVDYMSMDAHSVFRCYELKVSLADLKTDNKMSFYGDYNYLVVSERLYRQNPAWNNWIPPYCGILYSPALKTARQAKKKHNDAETREMLKDSLIRTLYNKMISYQNADALNASHALSRQFEQEKETLDAKIQEMDRKVWTYDDFEYYYRLNHQDPTFRIEYAAKEERRQFKLRKEGDLVKDNICPECGFRLSGTEKWCPECGMDLRRLNKWNSEE